MATSRPQKLLRNDGSINVQPIHSVAVADPGNAQTNRGFDTGTNVIVIAHGTYLDLPDGTKKIFPQGVGQKLSPKIPIE